MGNQGADDHLCKKIEKFSVLGQLFQLKVVETSVKGINIGAHFIRESAIVHHRHHDDAYDDKPMMDVFVAWTYTGPTYVCNGYPTIHGFAGFAEFAPQKTAPSQSGII